MLDYQQAFRSIEPYTERDIPAAIARILEAKEFSSMLAYIFPDRDAAAIKQQLHGIRKQAEFQQKFMYYVVKELVAKTADGVSHDGLQKLHADSPYLFIANHRDIVLDSSLLQALFLERNMPTSEIVSGNNLFTTPFITDLGKVNKIVSIPRNGNRLEIMNNSKVLSAYIRYTLTKKKTSLWIAQRNGRTKDGYDKTEEALLKMLNLSGEGELRENFAQLNIVPVSISYEYEPCAALKVNEMYASQKGTYEKKPGEDFLSIITGLTQQKGKIHLHVGTPVNDVLQLLDNESTNRNEYIKQIASFIDRQIYANYKLWKTNYIAFDLLHNSLTYNQYYTPAEARSFQQFAMEEIQSCEGEKAGLLALYYRMYANPVLNQKKG